MQSLQVTVWENVCWKELGLLCFVWVAFLVLQIAKVIFCSIYWFIFSEYELLRRNWSNMTFGNRIIQLLVQWHIGCWTCCRYILSFSSLLPLYICRIAWSRHNSWMLRIILIIAISLKPGLRCPFCFPDPSFIWGISVWSS